MENATLLPEVGRRIKYRGDIHNPPCDGVIVAVHGNPNPEPNPHSGVMRVIRANDCTFDSVLFDGRRVTHFHQCGLGGASARIVLQGRMHGPALIEVAKRNAANVEAARLLKEAGERQAHEAAEAARVIDAPPLFYWNGLKDHKGAPLQKSFYSGGELHRYPEGTLSIYARDYTGFSAQVREAFAVENDSDSMTDYFQKDSIRVIPSHPLYPQVLAALNAQSAHQERRAAKRA